MAGRDLSAAPLATLRVADLEPDDRIAPNFRLYELSLSQTAARCGIDNRLPDDATLRAAVHPTRAVLQPLRAQFGSFTPNSVFRSQALERALKKRPSHWISTSQHTQGRACDITIVAVPTLELARWAADHIPGFDQIICECYDPRQGPNSGWVHISMLPPDAGKNRGMVLSYIVDPRSGQLIYVNGLQASVA